MKLATTRWVGSLSMLAALGMPGIAFAEYPEQPITYTIPFDPGGESDVTARFQEPHLEEILGVDVNVNHRPGGGGAVGWSEFQNNAEPTGYEMIGVNIPHIIAQPIMRENAGYETDNWKIVTFFHTTPNALIVPKDSPFESLDDLVQYAKENPQAVTLGGSGTFSANHLGALRLEREADIDVTYIPFTGTGPLPAAVQGGHVSGIFNYSMLGVQMQDNARVLAVASEERVPALPDVPTFKELGYDIVGGAYRGVAVPKDTPDEIVNKLEEAFAQTNQRIAEKQEPLGFVMTDITDEEVDKIIQQLKSAYQPILEEAKANQ
ncbi:Bug family tripartite tricarboxylate transporter substrate binding protein [Modicisalibacter luteus]|uniref:Bug family tripartite tricarboxylate transporter substrate binding protein n=1 Tax=Modicisalibacter luteus TaxID=453962 RepID=A0ABV7LZK9_9GAMM|nr:tripartite tricarboxylate transporter substrate binding protein [Halomonas lutea]GHB01829.1 C4-dicarboxylate ABC transporter substrate-binding protein [Halomonas lutea]